MILRVFFFCVVKAVEIDLDVVIFNLLNQSD